MRSILVLFIVFFLTTTSCKKESTRTNQLIGTYSLLEWKGVKPDGSIVFPYGEKASGLIHYDAEGMMSMQLQRADRRSLGTDDYDTLDANIIREAYNGFFSYYGRYSVDQELGVITHYIEGCKNPDWKGRELKRRFSSTIDTLTLRSDNVIGMNHILKWERIEIKDQSD